MAIKLGSASISKLYLGSNEISKAYLGANEVFSSGDTTTFITTWRTTGANETITIPTTGGGYNYNIITSDGQTFTGVSGNQTITFASAGDYDVSISGDFPRIYINNNATNKVKLIDIKQWGNIVWSSFEAAFYGCSNLTGSFTDAPDLTNVVFLYRTFRNCLSFNQPIGNWDVSNVTNMNSMFHNARSFDQDISNWDVSNVTNMNSMFQLAYSFNGDISSWDVSKVAGMAFMFYRAYAFNQDIGAWDVSKVNAMEGMFRDAIVFNQDISTWDVTNVTNFNGFHRNITISTSNYDAILIGWEATLQAAFPNGSGYTPNISINFGNSEYTGGGAAATARASLVSNFGWTITDGGIA